MNNLKYEVTIKTRSNMEKTVIGNRIHNQLVGNPDYIGDNIILNNDKPNEIWLCIFEECEEIPKITIF